MSPHAAQNTATSESRWYLCWCRDAISASAGRALDRCPGVVSLASEAGDAQEREERGEAVGGVRRGCRGEVRVGDEHRREQRGDRRLVARLEPRPEAGQALEQLDDRGDDRRGDGGACGG